MVARTPRIDTTTPPSAATRQGRPRGLSSLSARRRSRFAMRVTSFTPMVRGRSPSPDGLPAGVANSLVAADESGDGCLDPVRRIHLVVFADRARWLDIEEVADSLECLDAALLAGRRTELPPDAADPDAEVLQIVAI